MNRLGIAAFFIIATIAVTIYLKEKDRNPVPVTPARVNRMKTQVVPVLETKTEEVKPETATDSEQTITETDVTKVEEKSAEVVPKTVPYVYVPAVAPKLNSLAPPAKAKVLLPPPKDDEDRLSTEDKIEDLQENVKLLKKELNELYKNKTLVGKYSSSDKVQNLSEDAIEYLKDPAKYSEKTSSEMVINVKQFLENVKKVRLEASKP